MPVIYRQNHTFKINKEHVKPEHRTTPVLNGLYAAVYEEFKGASENPKYEDMTYLERIEQINSFAEKWLKKRGFYQ